MGLLQFRTNLCTYAITRCNFRKSLNLPNTGNICLMQMVSATTIFFTSGISLSAIGGGSSSTYSDCFKNAGPCHHKAFLLNGNGCCPRDTMSAGFSVVLTYFHIDPAVMLFFWITRLRTNTSRVPGARFNQANTIWLSDHNTIAENVNWTVIDTYLRRDSRSAARSSILGMVTPLSGATLDLAHIKLAVAEPSSLMHRM